MPTEANETDVAVPKGFVQQGWQSIGSDSDDVIRINDDSGMRYDLVQLYICPNYDQSIVMLRDRILLLHLTKIRWWNLHYGVNICLVQLHYSSSAKVGLEHQR